jgi:hypothetical protein
VIARTCAQVCVLAHMWMHVCVYVYNMMSVHLLAAKSHQEIKIGAYKFGTGFRVILEIWRVK